MPKRDHHNPDAIIYHTKPKRLHIDFSILQDDFYEMGDPNKYIEARHVNCRDLIIRLAGGDLSEAKAVSRFLDKIISSKIGGFTICFPESASVKDLAAWTSMLHQYRQVLPKEITIEIVAWKDEDDLIWKTIRSQLREYCNYCKITRGWR